MSAFDRVASPASLWSSETAPAPKPHPKYEIAAAAVGCAPDEFEVLNVLLEMDRALDRDFLRAVGVALEDQP